MIGARIRSIRLSQGLSLVSVITLVLLAFIYIYFNRVNDSAESRYHRILQLQKTFVDLVTIENMVLSGGEHYANLLSTGMDLVEELEAESQYLRPGFIREREHVFSTLLSTVEENRQFYLDIRNTLPRLVANVRQIHAYHIESLQSSLSSFNSDPPSNTRSGFRNYPDKSASELEIIDSAVYVQNNLLDVIAVFYEMQLSENIDGVEELFQQRMAKFSGAVTRFEDFSLDAQDGLLVEELLLIGKHFRQAFGRLLQNNGKIRLLKKKLVDNQQQISAMFDDAAVALNVDRQELRQRLEAIQNISITVLVLLACWLIYYGVRLSRAFSRTVIEARKIGNDLTYRIPEECESYLEFSTIYSTLNSLAETADSQVKSLEKIHREMGRRVQERTAELVHMNTRLKNEIADRVKADDLRKELEDQLIRAKKMEAVGTLAGGVAHDLNNILSGVVTYPELLLLDMQEDDPLYKPLQNIKMSGDRAASIVQDLLTLARRGVAVKEVVEFRSLVQGYLESAEFGTLKKAHPEVVLDVDLADFTGNVMGSRMHLQKAVMNIIINGMEAMPEGGTLSISSRAVYVDTVIKGYDTVQEGDYVCLTVSDSGVGMSEEVVTQIFEPFFTRKKMGRSGTGLGMAVVYSTVKDHGGYIDIDSEPDKGSVITLYFPLTRESSPVREQSTDLLSLTGNSEHLLIVDDIFEQRQIASAMLKRLNYTVATAASGEEAVAYVRDNAVDLVLLDMIMPPGMDGFDTFMAIKAVVPEMPVVIASGYSENDRVRRALSFGAGTYIKKPYSVETLGKAIYTILNDA
ncbi:hybrid sensor histidine kinase/response regulator [Desulfopila aestuarii]|uniref:histidine kinase n=1 Tax=Desulfopila aestuarii DSM 18488 TaxID=1121416 RepID=A0A1M7YCF5_9BACT|nr:response regulator [Desulfopila aestuarii]SHO50256.1 His Kinase A (phospho-acceptor) domain-containing protein [Desulfopila aestuarii DSM 18488]